ncbi:uncharacterized protein LOC118186545 isoform X3 [Stegodyphus dumicola]|uniref:uncharacterized protein LOC118186545 isoform X3 n=1 Tax=Stegodyphus dumicola TaxID=202533 RepID=UPI0015ABD4E9|nr:uncharacterized protein LOC118186545 isoform X3 [Stegodyphus dumicola]
MDAPCSRTLSAKFCARPRLEKKRRPVTFFQSQGFTDFYAVISRGSSSPALESMGNIQILCPKSCCCCPNHFLQEK